MQKDHTEKIRRLEAQSNIVHGEFEKTMQNTIELLKTKGIHIKPKEASMSSSKIAINKLNEFDETRKKIVGNKTAVNVCCDDIAKMLDKVNCEKYNVKSSKEAYSVLSSLNGSHNIIMFINVTLPDIKTVDFIRNILGVKADKIIVLNGSTVTPEIMELLAESSCRPWFRPISQTKIKGLFNGFCEE
jgi:hypothetical protein